MTDQVNRDRPAKPDFPIVPRSVQWVRGALAICILLLLGTSILIFHYWSKAAEANMKVESIQLRYDSLLNSIPSSPLKS